jgi:hypothetical protein
LVHEHSIPTSDIPKIPATGPKGRLLKGDVLAYVGDIAPDYSSNLSARLSELAHLDLSNIKVTAPSKTLPDAQEQKQPPARTPTDVTDTEIVVPISLSAVLSIQKRIHEALGVTIPLTTFVARATDFANDDLPLSKSALHSADVVFEEILGLRDVASDPLTSRGNYIPQINTATIPEHALPAPTKRNFKDADIIDILSGRVSPNKSGRKSTIECASDIPASDDFAMNMFSVKVPSAEKLRGKVFLERMKTLLQDEPEKLVF